MSEAKLDLLRAIGGGRSDEELQKYSDDLKAKASRTSVDVGETIRVRARSGRPNGHYRAGVRLPGTPVPGPNAEVTWAEFETTPEGVDLLLADPAVFIELADGDDVRRYRKSVRWPPEGMTVAVHERMRAATYLGTNDR